MSEFAFLFVHTLTGLHPGSGTALGVVDLPVQRERHTNWPTIPASSLKGVLRDVCRPTGGDKNRDEWLAVFGPESADAHAHAGALALTDSRLIAFPVRSLQGVFAWVSCPATLERLTRDVGLTGEPATAMNTIPKLDPGKAACAEKSPLLASGGKMVLEEFEFERTGEIGGIAAWIAQRAIADEATAARFRDHFVILHDDDFTHFATHATEVTARVGLDYETKTVKTGALFYEEFLPPETLFYALAIAGNSRREGISMDADAVLGFLDKNMPPVLQIGGDATIGKGLCAIRLIIGGEAGK